MNEDSERFAKQVEAYVQAIADRIYNSFRAFTKPLKEGPAGQVSGSPLAARTPLTGRALRRAQGQRNQTRAHLVDEVEWSQSGGVKYQTHESFASVRAIQRVSGGRRRTR